MMCQQSNNTDRLESITRTVLPYGKPLITPSKPGINQRDFICNQVNAAGICGFSYMGFLEYVQFPKWLFLKHPVTFLFLFQVINGSLVFEDRHLVSGTLDGLVDYLVPSEDHYPETAFLFAFILTSRMFIRPHQLLATVFHRAFQDRSVS